MHKILAGGLAVVGLVGMLFAPFAAQAWSPLVLPSCATGPMVGREPPIDTGVNSPAQIDQDEWSATQNLSFTAIFDYHGPATYGRNAIIRGARINTDETQLRATIGNLVNGLKMECILQNIIARLGFSFAQRIDDTAAYDVNTRNHSLYQRTNDLQAEMAAMREEMAALRQEIRRTNTMNAVGGSTPTSPTAPVVTFPVAPIFAPAPVPVAPPVVVETKQAAETKAPSVSPAPQKEDGSAASQACMDSCGRSQLTCMKQANTSKALVQCSTDRTQCESACK